MRGNGARSAGTPKPEARDVAPGTDPARVVAGLVVIGLAVVTLAFPERGLRYVEGRRSAHPASVARVGSLLTAFVGSALAFGL